MHRISFDTNAGTQDLGYILWFPDSLRDIAAIGTEVRDGLHVIIYMPEELEMEAVLRFDEELSCWRGVPIPGTTRIISASD